MSGNKGSAMGTVLVIVGILGTLTLSMAAVSFHHLNFTRHAENRQIARNLAESAIAEAVARVVLSFGQNFGRRNEVTETVEVSSANYPPGSSGLLTFHRATADARKVHLSTNNLHGAGTILGSLDRSVAQDTLHLVATGRCGGVEYTSEALFFVPPFPNALACQGPFRSLGGLFVAGLSDPKAFNVTRDYATLPSEARIPSHVASNSNVANAVDLGPGARIDGNVAAVGGVKLAPGVQVSGEVRPNAGPQPLPQLDLDAIFGRVAAQRGKDVLPGFVSGNLETEWNAMRTGDLHVTGDLNLTGGLVYVSGNLEVDGCLRGMGAVFVGGTTRIHRGAEFEANDQVSLISRGSVRLEGQGRSDYYFQGLLYTEGDVQANDLTVLGAVVSRGIGGVTMTDVNLITTPVTVNLVEGLEVQNMSDDDSVTLVVKVMARDPNTRQPLSYRTMLRGSSDDAATYFSPPVYGTNLHSYEEVLAWVQDKLPTVEAGWVKNSYRRDWWWNASEQDHSATFGQKPLLNYIESMEGKNPDPNHHYTIQLDPNQVLGVVEKTRVLLWQEAPGRQ